jgi:hypothetical protein
MSAPRQQLKREFYWTVKQVERELNDYDETDDKQLNKFGKKHFGDEFGGVFAENEKINFDDNKSYYIFNTDPTWKDGTHWMGVYVNHKNKVITILDTFNRQSSKLLPTLIIDARKNHFKCRKGASHLLQRDSQDTCGQRSLAWLLLIKKYGADYVKRFL